MADFVDYCANWDVPECDKVLFFRYFLADDIDARQCYKNVMIHAKITGQVVTWKEIWNTFENGYEAMTKET